MGLRHLHYAAFGSNLSSVRFLRYLTHRSTPPSNEWGWVDGAVYFAGHSVNWLGPVAFLDIGASQRSLVRRYEIDGDELLGLWAAENGRRTVDATTTDLAGLEPGTSIRVDITGKYDTLHRLDETTFTITTSKDLPRGAPPHEYLDTILAGLDEHPDLDEVHAYRQYLEGHRGD